jgi:Ca2+-transporting ATPase
MQGLTTTEARARLEKFGPNALPEAAPPSFLVVFLRQFLSPLIYILVAAAVVAMVIGDVKDALFIGVVLLINGVIGAVQEHSAGQAAAALREHDQPHALVVRDGVQQEIDARDLVPGDLVLLEAGRRVPADTRLVETNDLRCDESLLTGESLPVKKEVSAASEGREAQRRAMAFAGSIVTRGRGAGEVTATGLATEVGKIAGELVKPSVSQPPLIIRMERFSRMIALLVAVAVAILVAVGWMRHMGLAELFMMAVGLAVAAIPEGLPVAIAVALAISMRRMAKANVIVRKMPAVEALGSCTMIATDKTGTLTMNELTVTDILLPDGSKLSCESSEGVESYSFRAVSRSGEQADLLVAALLRAAALPNEAEIRREKEEFKGVGDTVDVALLVAAHRIGVVHDELRVRYPLVKRIPYEPDLKYAASFHRHEEKEAVRVFVKGAPETLIAMADRMDLGGTLVPIDRETLARQKSDLSQKGLRVLAFAEGETVSDPEHDYGPRHLQNLVFLGLVGMQDPLRPEAARAIQDCYSAGVEVAMVTGDSPETAAAIAKQAGMAFGRDQIVTGADVREAEESGETALDELTRRARIYARVEPIQKLAIVLSLARNGHFVAVTGDGVNDAPALKHAHVGVAMGKQGTDVAKESADIIITDDNFASILRGILEGRVAYANIRKVIFLLVSTGAAELLLFLLTIPLGLPMPLLPVQLLWLNLVTNGVQHIALAAEKPEGDELTYPPRRPQEPIFDRVMITRNVYSALVMAGVGFGVFYWLLERGYDPDHARNLLLLLFVVFENFQALNARSEHHSLFHHGLFSSRLLVGSVIGAQAIHLAAMHVPGLADTLRIWPVTIEEWAAMLALGSSLLVVMEIEKWWMERHKRPATRVGEPVVAAAPAPSATAPSVAAAPARYWPVATAAGLLVAVGAAGALYWLVAREGGEPPFDVATVERGPIVLAVEADGEVVAAPPVPLAAPVGGTVEKVACQVGDRVQQGRVCAAIASPALRTAEDRAQKALAAAQSRSRASAAALARAKAAYERNQELAQRRSVSAATLAKSRTAFERAQARAERAEAQVADREKALASARERLARGIVASPIAGTVRESRLAEDRKVAAGAPLLVIAPPEGAWRVEATLGAADLSKIRVGSPAEVTIDGRKIEAEVREIVEADRKVVIQASAPEAVAAPGAKAKARIEIERRDDALRAPNRAIRYTPASMKGEDLGPPPVGSTRLWVLRDGRPQPVLVELGLDDGVHVEVRGGPLEAGDRILLDERD